MANKENEQILSYLLDATYAPLNPLCEMAFYYHPVTKKSDGCSLLFKLFGIVENFYTAHESR